MDVQRLLYGPVVAIDSAASNEARGAHPNWPNSPLAAAGRFAASSFVVGKPFFSPTAMPDMVCSAASLFVKGERLRGAIFSLKALVAHDFPTPTKKATRPINDSELL